MEPEEDQIVEVEVIDEKIDEPRIGETTRMPSTDHSVQIGRYAKLSHLFLRIGPGAFFLFLILSFYFMIFASQRQEAWANVLMIVFWSCCGLSAVIYILGIVFFRLMKAHMRKDPNYKDRLE